MPKAIEESVKKEAVRLYETGLVQREIAAITGISRGTVSVILTENGYNKELRRLRARKDDISDEEAASILTASDVNDAGNEPLLSMDKNEKKFANKWNQVLYSESLVSNLITRGLYS